MKRLYISIITILLFSAISFAQSNYNRCGTTEYMASQFKDDPLYEARLAELNRATIEWMKANTEEVERSAGAILTIPVVVHIVYRNSAQNISDAKVQSQIDVLNEDYRRTNSNAGSTPSGFLPVADDTEIEFCLAVRDPFGAPSTGITRTPTNTNSFSTNNQIKYTATGGIDAWPTSQYLNIWVGPLGSSLLGYAQFPGGSSATDGVVILYSAFGRNSPLVPYNLGRTTTHEVGHYLNLRHIWGDSNCGNDFVNDTPEQPSSNFGCPGFPKLNNCSGGDPVNGDMFMNYMDYTNDACMNMFTEQQGVRMQFAINSARASLLNSKGCDAPVVGIDPLNSERLFDLYPNPVSNTLNLNIRFDRLLSFEVQMINMLGENVKSFKYDESLGGEFEMELTELPKGIYFARLLIDNHVYSRKIVKE